MRDPWLQFNKKDYKTLSYRMLNNKHEVASRYFRVAKKFIPKDRQKLFQDLLKEKEI